MSRPFGVALLIAGFDRRVGPQLFFSDPSGTYLQYEAKAIGAGSEGAQSTLQDKYNAEMTLHEAEDLAFEVLKQVMEDKISSVNVEVASITEKVRIRIRLSFSFVVVVMHSTVAFVFCAFYRVIICSLRKNWNQL